MTGVTTRIRCEELRGGAVWHVRLAAPKGNVLDRAMAGELDEVFRRVAEAPRVCAVVLGAEGPHFSFGASVAEHLPEQVAPMLEAFHGLFRSIAAAGVPVVAAVRGQCLGGGLELAAFCHRLVVAPDARLGQPEIKLGVFAPVASALLPERIGTARAAELCLSGRSVSGEEAVGIGLADELAADPDVAALAWIESALLAHSASSVRIAAQAVRHGLHARLFATLEHLERLYLGTLMETRDAVDGIRAFLDKRPAAWRHA